jgi:hypothetical protein
LADLERNFLALFEAVVGVFSLGHARAYAGASRAMNSTQAKPRNSRIYPSFRILIGLGLVMRWGSPAARPPRSRVYSMGPASLFIQL